MSQCIDTQGGRAPTKDADAHYYRGCANLHLKNYQPALADFSVAIQARPDFAQAYYQRGATYNLLGNRFQGQADINRALQLDPNVARNLVE